MKVSPDSAWVGAVPGTTAPVAFSSTQGLVDNLLLPGVPDLLWVENNVESPRWALLSPVVEETDSITYTIRTHGSLPVPVSDEGRLVHDQLGVTTALVDAENGTILGFDPKLSEWFFVPVPESYAHGLTNGSMALVGPKLYVASGDDSRSLLSFDVFGGALKVLALSLPDRWGGELILSTDRRALLLVGGTDSNGGMHDDVWAVDLPHAGSSWDLARLVRAESGRPGLVMSPTATVAGSSRGDDLRAWTIQDEDGAGIISAFERGEGGWIAVDERGVASAGCSEADEEGGELCSLTPAWWGSPGARACAIDPDAGTCRGGAGEAVAELTLRARTDVLDAASDGRVVWVLTRSALERWSVDGAPLRTHEIALSGRGRALGARHGQIVVATDAGVHVVDTSGGGVSLGAALPLCGRPLRVAHLRGSLWAVVTTLGMGVVNTASYGAPLLVSMSALQPDPSGSGWAVPVDLSQDSWCAELDEAIPEAQMNMLARGSAMASFEGRLLVARGPFVMNVDVTDPSLPEALGTVATHITLERLRVDTLGGRAYGSGTGAVFRRKPVFDLRSGGFRLAGQHDVTHWVERNDAAGLSIRLLGGTRVAVARVVR